METILVVTDNTRLSHEATGKLLQQLYPQSKVRCRAFTDELLTELATAPLPGLILIGDCTSSLPLMSQLKAHPRLCRIPVLMLRVDGNRRNVRVQNAELRWLIYSVKTLGRHHLN